VRIIDNSIVFFCTLLLISGCMTPVFSSLDRYSDATGLQRFSYYVCQASSARAEGRVEQAYMMDVYSWNVLKEYGLKQPMVIQLFQRARHQGEKYTYSMAEESCRQWSIYLPANS